MENLKKLIVKVLDMLGMIKWETNMPHDRHVEHYTYIKTKAREAVRKKLHDNWIKDMRSYYDKKDFWDADNYMDMVTNLRREWNE